MVIIYLLTCFPSNLTADNRGCLRELEGLEKLVDFVGNKVELPFTVVKYTSMRLYTHNTEAYR